ncbi:MAG: SIS domain-containing protein, partial [Acidimicrobiia bacterium]
MEKMIAGLGGQLRWAASLDRLDLAESAAMLVCGMGGSGISGDFAAEVAAVHGRRLSVHKGYGLPGWTEQERPLVVAVSYSGNTEETLSAVEDAGKAGLAVVAVTSGGTLASLADQEGWPTVLVPGGLQPRAAAGYLIGSVVRVAEGSGLVEDPRPDLEEAAWAVDELIGPDCRGPARPLADDLAAGLDGRVAVVYGSSGLTAPAAQRWKTQINENAKWPAWWSLLPELDHNEIVGWTTLSDLTRRRVGVVTLRDRHEHPRVAARFRLT